MNQPPKKKVLGPVKKATPRSEPPTHEDCVKEAAKYLKTLPRVGVTSGTVGSAQADRAMLYARAWLELAAEIRQGDELASYKFDLLKRRLEQETM